MLSFQIFQSKHYPAVRALFLKCKKPNRGDVGGLLKNTKRDSPKTGARNRQKKSAQQADCPIFLCIESYGVSLYRGLIKLF